MNIIIQVDSDGHNLKTLDGIVDYKRYNYAISEASAFVTNKRGVRKLRQTTIRCNFLIQWKDGTTTWMTLNIPKESNPVEVMGFSVERGISDEPAFSWWVPFTLKKRDMIIFDVN